jgi:hypothetical protein
MGVFDQAARHAAKLNAAGFLSWLVPGAAAELVLRGWLDTRTLPFPGEPDRTCDTVAEYARADGQGPLQALVVEFQTEPEGDIYERLAEYVLRLRKEIPAGTRPRDKYTVAGALVNLTGPAQADVWAMAPTGFGGAGLRFQVVLRTLRDEDAAVTLAGIAAGRIDRCILPWLPLMQGGAEPGIIQEWLRLASLEPDNRLRATYGGLALVLAELTDCRPVWQKALEGWNVRESQQVLEWQAEARKEGLVEGKVEEARAKILRVLQVRFGADVPADLSALVEAQANLDVLNRWFDQALTAATLDDFRAAVT